jgi:hypothetical protein
MCPRWAHEEGDMKYLKAMIWPVLAVLCGCRDAAAPHVVDVISYDTAGATECVVRRDGSVWCWGSNTFGRAGQPLEVKSVEQPTQVAGIQGATQLSMGMFGGCALTSDAVWCWSDGASPAKVEGLPEGITSVVVRDSSRCALSADGSVWCWGKLIYSDGSGDHESASPRRAVALPKIVSLEREGSLIARDEQGERFMGSYDLGILGGLARERVAKQVVSLRNGMVLEDERGRVWALKGIGVVSREPFKLNFRMVGPAPYELPELAGVSGWSSYGSSACGVRDAQVRCVASMVLLHDLEQSGELPGHLEWRGVKQVVVTGDLVYGLDGRGAVRWANVTTQSLVMNTARANALSELMSALGEGWERLERSGADVVCVMGAKGRRCWGDDGVALDAQLQALAPASSGFAASSKELCVLGAEGVVRCVGRSAGSRAATRLEGATQLAGNYRHMCALKAGAVWCWDGEGAASQGMDVVITRLEAVGPDVIARDAAGAAYVIGAPASAGGLQGVFKGDDVAALRGDPTSAKMLGMAMTFRHNAQMEGGCALEAERGLVRCVANGEERGVVRIEAGARQIAVHHSTSGCALMEADGTVRCWEDSEVKTVEGLRGLTQLDFKSGWGCGVGEGGAVWCWGKNWRGQLGVKGEVSGPVQVPGVSGATRVELWDEASCAILADGSRKCWGDIPEDL